MGLRRRRSIAIRSIAMTAACAALAIGGSTLNAAAGPEEAPIVSGTITTTGAPPASVTYRFALTCGGTTTPFSQTVQGAGAVPLAAPACGTGQGEIGLAIVDDEGATTEEVDCNPELLPQVTCDVAFFFAPVLSMEVSPPEGPVNTSIVVKSADPCPPGTDVTVHIEVVQGTTTIAVRTLQLGSEGGSWETTFNVPSDTPPGSLTITATCLDAGPVTGDVQAKAVDLSVYQVQAFQVLAPPAAAPLLVDPRFTG